jgi:uncharacterized protein YbjT (DUF2867 family)
MIISIIGATGLVGGILMEELLNDNDIKTVRILIRRTVELTHPKLEKKWVDFEDDESFRLALENTDIVFCATGTTQKKVKGDKAAYRKVDYDIPVKAAQFCKLNGCETFVLVSSIGADAGSKNFYLKLKGEVEFAIANMGLKSVHIMQPSLLLGNRNEKRVGESVAGVMMKLFKWMIPATYKPIEATKVAKAMIHAAKNSKKGVFYYRYTDMNNLPTA